MENEHNDSAISEEKKYPQYNEKIIINEDANNDVNNRTNIMNAQSNFSQTSENMHGTLRKGYQEIFSDRLKLQIAQYLLNLHPQLLQDLLRQATGNIHQINTSMLNNPIQGEINEFKHLVPIENKKLIENHHWPNEIPIEQSFFTILPQTNDLELHNEMMTDMAKQRIENNDESYFDQYAEKKGHNIEKNFPNPSKQEIDTHTCVPVEDSLGDNQQTYIIFRIDNKNFSHKIYTSELCDSSTKNNTSCPPLSQPSGEIFPINHWKNEMYCHDGLHPISELQQFEISGLENDATYSPITRSRFRVKRIADASSWWTPNKIRCPLVVHDLKTSALPDYIQHLIDRNAEIQKNIISGVIKSIEDMKSRFWNVLDPDYLQKLRTG